MPISFVDANGELGGVSRFIFDRIQEISGLRFRYEALPNGAVTYTDLIENGFDLITSVEYNEENLKANGILVSRPYLSSRKVIVGHSGVALESDDLRIAVATGSQTLKKVLSEEYPRFEVVDFDTIEDCFRAVNGDGRADLLIQNQYIAEYRMHKPQYENLVVLPTAGLDDRLCFSAVTPLEHTDDAVWTEKERIVEILNKAIARISDDDIANYIIRANMENQYHDTPADFLYRYRYMAGALLAAFVVMLALVVALVRQRMRAIKAQADADTRTQFLSMMSHELRTPLNGLIGLNYLIGQTLGDEEKVRGHLQQSTATAKYLLTMLNDILDMSRLERRQVQLENRPFSLEGTLMMADSAERDRMEEKGLTYLVEREVRWPTLIGDEIRVDQVLLSLLDNACKFTEAGAASPWRSRRRRQAKRFALGSACGTPAAGSERSSREGYLNPSPGSGTSPRATRAPDSGWPSAAIWRA